MSSKMMVALIGCGEHARLDLLPSLLQIADIELVAICDPDPGTFRQIGQIPRSVACYADYQQLFTHKIPLHAIVVAATPQVHSEAAKLALERGIHVFTEKPPAVTTASLVELATIADARGLVAAVGHNLRYATTISILTDLIRRQTALYLDVRYLVSGSRGDRWSLGSPLRSFLLSHVIHVVDLVLSVLGKPRTIRSTMMRLEDGGILLSACLEFDDNRMSSFVVGNVASSFQVDVWTGTSDGQLIHVDGLRAVHCYGSAAPGKRWSQSWHPKSLEVGYRMAGYLGELEAFFQAIRAKVYALPLFREEIAVYLVLDEIEAQALALRP